jgi:hypothetical protein
MVADPDSFAFAVEYTFALANSPSSRMTIKCSPGQANNQSAAIVELFVTQQGDLAFAKVADGIVTWLDNAHRSIRETFQLMTSDRLKQAMGPKRPVRRQ